MDNKLENVLTAMLMSGAYMDEEDAREFAFLIINTMEEGYYIEHEERNPLGTTVQFFAAHRWEPTEHVPTVEGVKEAQAEMEEWLNRITGTTAEERTVAVAATMLQKMGQKMGLDEEG